MKKKKIKQKAKTIIDSIISKEIEEYEGYGIAPEFFIDYLESIDFKEDPDYEFEMHGWEYDYYAKYLKDDIKIMISGCGYSGSFTVELDKEEEDKEEEDKEEEEEEEEEE
jgi:hypothetical protein